MTNTPVLGSEVQYLAYSHETCPTTGRAHWQFFAYGRKGTLTAWIERIAACFGTVGAHVELCNGSLAEQKTYINKQSAMIELGDKPMDPGHKRSYKDFKESLDAGDDPRRVARRDVEMFTQWTHAHRAFGVYQQFVREQRVRDDYTKPYVHVRYGPPGVGKSRYIRDLHGTDHVVAPDNNGRWFDNCDRDVIVFDDVEAGAIPSFSDFKRLTDRYAIQVPIKGGFIWWKPKYIYFTSNFHPYEWWPALSDADKGALDRRLTSCTYVTEYINPTTKPMSEDGLSEEHDWTEAEASDAFQEVQ